MALTPSNIVFLLLMLADVILISVFTAIGKTRIAVALTGVLIAMSIFSMTVK